MTTYFPTSVVCSRCGVTSAQQILGSTTSFGRPDLDGRPPPPRRNTMGAWLQECANCLFVAQDLSIGTAEEFDVVKEIGFIEAGLSENIPDLAIRFMRRAYIDAQTGQTRKAIWRLLHAAWVLDDFELDATSPRKRALGLIRELGDEADLNVRILQLDLLRRTASFGEVHEAAKSIDTKLLDENQRRVVVAQRRGAIEGRRGAISFREALSPRRPGEPPARISTEWLDIFP